MRSRVVFLLSSMVLASAAVIATGCSQDTLSGGSQDLNMTYTPSPAGAGRFDIASFKVNTIQIVPTDPQEAALFGANRMLLRFDNFTADLTATQPVFYSHIALAAGSYRVTTIAFTPPALVDSNLPTNPATCIDGVPVIDAQSTTGVPQVFTFDNPSTLIFTVQPGQTSLALTVDVPGLIAGYEAAFTCAFFPCPGCPVDPKPTVAGSPFNTQVFRDALMANITIK